MSESNDYSVQADAADPVLQFERKLKLSIYITPSVFYMYIDTGQPYPVMQLTTNAANATTFALYRVVDSPIPETYMLQHTPAMDTEVAHGGLFVTVQGGAGPVMLMALTDFRLATRFTLKRSGDEYHFMVQSNGLYLSAENQRPPATYFLAPDRDLFHGHTWKAQTVQMWNRSNMDNADLRYVHGLKSVCAPDGSYRNAKLRRADFRGAQLTGSHFDGAECSFTLFLEANLTGCHFTNATVTGAYLDGVSASGLIASGVDFSNTSFNGYGKAAQLGGATLNDAVFNGRDLSGVDFTGANLARAKFRKCELKGSVFNTAEMAAAVLDEATAAGAKFEGAKMAKASLVKAGLQGAVFKNAVLRGACFADAVFGSIGQGPRTDFGGATLYDIDFSRCLLTQATLPTPTRFLEKDDVVPGPTQPRPSLRGCTVPIEVLGTAKWRMLDLSGATILGQLPKSLEGFVADYCIFPDRYDLAERDLLKANFRYAQLLGAKLDNTAAAAENSAEAPDFSHANLTQASFVKARLPFALFENATLYGVKMSYARLTQSSFKGARLDTTVSGSTTLVADLSYCVLLDANFENAFLGKGRSAVGANLSYVTFTGSNAKITNATLDGAQFSGAYLTALDFTGNSDKAMEGVNFAGACLANCMLKKASLQQANLSNACLLGTDFSDANLHTASMSGANLSFAKVELEATCPDQKKRTVPCEPTKIETKATDSYTTCPIGTRGPCEGPAWIRTGGTATVWPSTVKD